MHLLELHLVGAVINFNQQVTFADALSFDEVNLHDLAIDAALDVGGVECRYRAQSGEIDGDILALDGRHRNRDGMGTGGMRLLLFGIGDAAADEVRANCRKESNRGHARHRLRARISTI